MIAEEIDSEIIIVGGGPSTLTFLIDIMRSGRLLSLFKGKGVTILEKGRYFGCGRLEQYVINSEEKNSVFDMFRIILKEPQCYNRDLFSHLFPRGKLENEESGGGVTYSENLSEKINEIMEQHVLVGFKEVLKTNVYQELVKYASMSVDVPLCALGYYLRVVGNTLLRWINSLKNQLIFRPYHELQSVQLQNDGAMSLSVKVLDPNGPTEQLYMSTQIDQTESRNIRPQVLDHYKKAKCRVLLLCVGTTLQEQSARQSLLSQKPKLTSNNSVPTLFLGSSKSNPLQVSLSSDQLLTDIGFTNTMKHLQKISDVSRHVQKGRVIIKASGGAGDENELQYLSEALLCVNALLKGPVMYNQSEIIGIGGGSGSYGSANWNRRSSVISQVSSSNYNPQLKRPLEDELTSDSLSPFLQKRGLEGQSSFGSSIASMNSQQRCRQCAMFMTSASDTVSVNISDSSISIRVNRVTSESMPNSARGSGIGPASIHGNSSPYAQRNSQYFSPRMSINSNSQLASNSYLSKRTGLSQAGISVLNLHSGSINNNRDSTADLTSADARSTTNLRNSLSTLGSVSSRAKLSGQVSPQAQVFECLCLGSIKPLVYKWKREDVLLAEFAESEIVILVSSRIFQAINSEKNSEEENNQDNLWKDLPQSARQLLKLIQSGSEKRVSIIEHNLSKQSSSHSITDLLAQAAIVVHANGVYVSAPVSIKGIGGDPLSLRKNASDTLIMKDARHRLLTPQGALKSVFCMGTISSLYSVARGGITQRKATQNLRSVGQISDEESKNVGDCVIDAILSSPISLQAQDALNKLPLINVGSINTQNTQNSRVSISIPNRSSFNNNNNNNISINSNQIEKYSNIRSTSSNNNNNNSSNFNNLNTVSSSINNNSNILSSIGESWSWIDKDGDDRSPRSGKPSRIDPDYESANVMSYFLPKIIAEKNKFGKPIANQENSKRINSKYQQQYHATNEFQKPKEVQEYGISFKVVDSLIKSKQVMSKH